MNTLPFLLYKFIESGLVLGTMIIFDRKHHIKDRIMLSGVKPITYISGMTTVYFLLSCLGSAIYCIVALLLKFDFCMKYPIYYFIMLCLVNLFSAALYVFFSSIVNSNESLDGTGYIVLLFAFFSGMLFPFDYMPKAFKLIGSFAPQRWIVVGIKNIQKTGMFSSALPQIALLIGVSMLLLIIGTYRNCKKTYNN
jgi:ABC-2 type transport system permease protein